MSQYLALYFSDLGWNSQAQCLRLMLGLKRKIWMMIETMDIFGLDQLNRVARWAQPITYLDIYECDSFTVSI